MITNTFLEIATSLFIIIGAVVLVFASIWIRNILRISADSSLYQSWRWLYALTIFFLIGYLSSITLIIFGLSRYLLVASGVIFFMGAFFVFFVGRISYKTILEYQDTSEELRTATNELQSERTHLEEQVILRTKNIELRASQLQAVSDVARNISMILNTDDLLPAITNLISQRFGYFYTGIYLLNNTKDNLVLSAANFVSGKNLATQQSAVLHDLSSLPGLAVRTGEIKIAHNSQNESEPAPKSILDNTLAEAAVPLHVGDEIIGVLDIQQDKNIGFSDDDISILRTLASLIAIAIQNAHSFDQLKIALANAESSYQHAVQQGWSQVSKKLASPGYRYSQNSLVRIKDQQEIERMKLIATGEEVISSSTQNEPATVTVPIKYRDQVFGVLNVSSTIDRQNWGSNEIALIRAIAERGGQALENARLLVDLQRRAAREQTIGEISTKISAANDIDSILRSTVEELGKKIVNAEIAIRINDQDSFKA